jgi:hypothetical protein
MCLVKRRHLCFHPDFRSSSRPTNEGTGCRSSALLRRLERSVKSMRTRTSAALLTSALKLASQAIMGIAMGLAFVIVLTRFDPAGIMALISDSPSPRATLILFEGTVVLSFAVGATLTGLVFMMTEDS